MRKANPREMGLPSRLQHLADLVGSVSALAELTGVSRRSLTDWLNLVRVANPKALLRIARATGVDGRWLRDGEGFPPPRLKPPDREEFLQLVPAEFQPFHSIGSISKVWARLHLKLDPEQLIFLTAADRSMSPTIEPNEPVIGFRIPLEERSNLIPDPNKIYIIEIHDCLVLRRVKPYKAGRTPWVAYRDNAPLIKGGLSSVIDLHQIVGQAVWTGRCLSANLE